MSFDLSLNTGPTLFPITLEEAKEHLRITHGLHDSMITELIKVAAEEVENATRRQLMKATWDLKVDRFWGELALELPRPPLLSVASITYVDGDGDTQTVDSSVYTVDTTGVFGRVYLAYGQSWPTDVRDQRNAVTAQFICGYSASATEATAQAALPRRARHLTRLLVEDFYNEAGVTGFGTVRIPDNPRFEDLVQSLAVPINDAPFVGAA